MEEFNKLPDRVKRHCTYSRKRKMIRLMDETDEGVVCMSPYAKVIVAAIEAYVEHYLDK